MAIRTLVGAADPGPESNRFLTLPDVAEMLGVSVRKVYTLVREGALPGIHIGGKGTWRIYHPDLIEYMERGG